MPYHNVRSRKAENLCGVFATVKMTLMIRSFQALLFVWASPLPGIQCSLKELQMESLKKHNKIAFESALNVLPVLIPFSSLNHEYCSLTTLVDL